MKTEPDLDLAARIAALYREVDALAETFAQAGAAQRISRGRLSLLRRTGRAFQQAESSEQWTQILCDAAASLSQACAFFRLQGAALVAEGFRGPEPLPVAGPVPLAAAPAFRQAIETAEPVVALKTPSQLGPATGFLWPDSPSRKAHLFPLAPQGETLGVLYAEGDPLDADAMEVLLSLAAASLLQRREKPSPSVSPTPPGLISIAAPASAPPAHVAGYAPAPESRRDELTPEVIEARRFARTRVASWILQHPNAIARGRAERDVYAHLRHVIDSARVEYLRHFGRLPIPNYLDREILERIACNDATLLGPARPTSYPD